MEVINAIIDFMFYLLRGFHMPLGSYDFTLLDSIIFAGIICIFISVIVAIFGGGRED